MTPEEIGAQHAVAAVDVWPSYGKYLLRWTCACRYRQQTALEVPPGQTPHDTLREAHFRHIRAEKKRAGVL